ncbi:MAG: hypothetical protein WBQ53_08895 [Methylocystis sp.]
MGLVANFAHETGNAIALGVVAVDKTSIDAFLNPARIEAEHGMLFFVGDPA